VKAHCYSMKDRSALFLIDPGKDGDELLALLDKYPRAQLARFRVTARTAGWCGVNGELDHLAS
jgi:hypothetical protein